MKDYMERIFIDKNDNGNIVYIPQFKHAYSHNGEWENWLGCFILDVWFDRVEFESQQKAQCFLDVGNTEEIENENITTRTTTLAFQRSKASN